MDARQLAERLAGKFIVFDGPDGGGKSTQIELLRAYLADGGAVVETVADPGTTAIGQKIRALLLERHDMAIAPMCEVMLFMASRAQLVAERVRPAVAAGKVVLCDRFISATVAYQGALGVSRKTIIELGQAAIGGLWPDLTIVLDLPSKDGLDRSGRRDAQADRMESRELAYHQRVREIFAELGKDYPGKVCYVDAGADKQVVFRAVLTELEKLAAQEGGADMSGLLDIVGQDGALAQLQRTLQGGRRPHSFLFLGPEGVGRRTTAEALARLLLCESPRRQPNAARLRELPDDFPLLLPCDQCPSCRTAEAGTNPDLLIVHRQLARFHDDTDVRKRVMQDLGIDVIRQFLLEPAYRTSAGGRGRVFVVREAELMSVPAQNALLKTLEEPPEGVSIILLAPSAEELLPTTRSRCQVVRFGPLDRKFVADRLSGQGTPAAEARFWAELTEGSLGRAMRLAAQGQYAFKRDLVDALAGLSPGAESQTAEMLNKAMESQAARLTKADDQLAATLANRQGGQAILTLVVSLYRDALTVACGQSRPLMHADQAQQVGRIAQRFGVDALSDILAQLARYEELLWRNVNAKLLWDNVAITCATAAAFEVDA